MNPMCLSGQQGFSLPETLFALLLLSAGITALLKYHQALTQSAALQWQQRLNGYHAAQRIEGRVVERWQVQWSVETGPAGCKLLNARAGGVRGREATLVTLRCEP